MILNVKNAVTIVKNKINNHKSVHVKNHILI